MLNITKVEIYHLLSKSPPEKVYMKVLRTTNDEVRTTIKEEGNVK